MRYKRTIVLNDGRECVLRNATADDGKAVLENFILTHAQTDELLTYPDEITVTAEQESEFLQRRADSDDETELIALVGNAVAGSAGIGRVGSKYKLRHRASFGISIDKEYWGLGIGRALTEGCIECARKAGYTQLELDVAADNERALTLYRSVGFTEYGRNPLGFRSRISGWQELVLMRLVLKETQ